MGETSTEWGVRAFHPCPDHGMTCPHSYTAVQTLPSKEAAQWYIDGDVYSPTPMVNPSLVRRTVTEWEEHKDG